MKQPPPKKLRKTVAETYHEIGFQLVDLGLRASSKDYVKFIILARSRTGSNLLKLALEPHPNTLLYGELFMLPRIRWDRQLGSERQRWVQLAHDEPQEFVKQKVFRKYPAQLRAVGFKLFYYHAREAPRNQLWPHLRDDKELHIIHLRRRNILKTFLSKQLAMRTGQWRLVHSGSKEKTVRIDQSTPIRLDYETCLQEFSTTRAYEEDSSEYFSDHPVLNLWYEDLVEDYSEQFSFVQNFLQLEPRPLVPLTRKQAKLPLDKQIENYDELKQQFAASEWAEFFEV